MPNKKPILPINLPFSIADAEALAVNPDVGSQAFEPEFQEKINNVLFSRYVPAFIVVNDEKEIVRFNGDTSPFLVPPVGTSTFNLFKMLRRGLVPELKSALIKAKNTKSVIIKENIPVIDMGYNASFEVIPLEEATGTELFMVVLYKKEVATNNKKFKEPKKTADQIRIIQLEGELLQMRKDDIMHVREAIILQQQNDALEENNQELSSFSYIAGHDLQEPLRKIHTFSKMLIEGEGHKLSETGKMYLDRTIISIKRLQQLTNDLLHYSHVSKANEEDFQDTDFKSLVNDALFELKEVIENKSAIITVLKLPVLKALPLLMQQIFINLIGNAVKYSKAGIAPIINISARIALESELSSLNTEPTQQYYKIMVSDNGVGFPQKDAGIIFEPFRRLHGKDKYEGTGIGLAICKKIVAKHKGFITADSTPGVGTTCNVYLPF